MGRNGLKWFGPTGRMREERLVRNVHRVILDGNRRVRKAKEKVER